MPITEGSKHLREKRMNRNPEAMKSTAAELSRRLERHPTVKARVERMLDLIENAGGDLKRADEAERRAIDELRALGQELLGDWGQRLADAEAASLEADRGLRRQVKKTALAQHLR